MLLRDERAHVGVLLLREAEHQGFRPGFQRSDEAIEDRPLDVHALGREAHLPGIGEDRVRHSGDRCVEVAIGEDDAGILAAQLEGDRLHGRRDRFHDRRARCGFAGEGDPVYFRVRGDELARRIGSEAVHDVVHARRHAGLVHDLGEQGRGRGRFFRRFRDDGIAAGERRCELPGEEQKRQVPGCDHADHAEGFPHGIVHRAFSVRRVEVVGLRAVSAHDVGEDAEVRRAARNVEMARERHRFARIGDFRLQEIVEAFFDPVGDLAQQIDARLQRHPAPGAFQRSLRGAHRRVDHRAVGLVNLRDHGAVDRIDLGELPAAADELAVDIALALGNLDVRGHGNLRGRA